MSKRTTVVLLIVLILLGAYVYFFELQRGQTQEELTAETEYLFKVDAESITGLEVHDNKGNVSCQVFLDDEGNWHMKKPVPKEADNSRLSSLTSRIARIIVARKLEGENLDLSEFGLADPTHTVYITTTEQVYALQIGDKTPQGSGYYVQLQDEKDVYIVYTSIIEELKRLVTNPPEKPTPTPTPTETPSSHETPAETPEAE